MGKFCALFFIFCFVFVDAFSQIGCAVGGTLYTSRRGMSRNFDDTPSQTLALGCYFTYTSGSNNCTVKSSPDLPGFLVDSIECPIDESYALLGFGILISVVSLKKNKIIQAEVIKNLTLINTLLLSILSVGVSPTDYLPFIFLKLEK
ncbi:hypothetical protein EZ449_09455 [Pedobacter frigidisoli]|uniref:Uncharacterized protein n=1 Tax=Pedobacter frigidisoli TaxID=2530455 RepID=A0A4R0P255_9SPHI|nr:hypothetical protein [Pedobacter frigidisoli]TCD10560.1 hypothetical protein EZ449_09455 [Pedobacter frigidisoli]